MKIIKHTLNINTALFIILSMKSMVKIQRFYLWADFKRISSAFKRIQFLVLELLAGIT